MRLEFTYPDGIYEHGNYIWKINAKEKKVIIVTMVARDGYFTHKHAEFQLKEGPYSFFFQDNYGIICNKESNEVWLIEGDCNSDKYDPKIIETFKVFRPYCGILSPDNKFIILAEGHEESLKFINLEEKIEEDKIYSFCIRENINQLSFKEGYLIINEDFPLGYERGTEAIIIKLLENDHISYINKWEEKQQLYYEFGWYPLLCPAYIDRLKPDVRNEITEWMEKRYLKKWKEDNETKE